jgi:hypothetical protein
VNYCTIQVRLLGSWGTAIVRVRLLGSYKLSDDVTQFSRKILPRRAK